ncbi:acyl-CoA Delta-9 desaturase-like [Venturia canescens]|uniref:acyl-CoA Delta-9 desaturase-like n=1 Tax=Venturia canescens TaxID=32260 RepID=UPI001C9C5142|nr:acyl-CoA Delta-9 desaturase-like [Venturia canescens]
MPPTETMTVKEIEDAEDMAGIDDLVKDEHVDEIDNSSSKDHPTGPFGFKTPIIWSNVVRIFGFHFVALYGLLTVVPLEHKLLTLWSCFMCGTAGFGVTGGAHRYWTHRSYKANMPLRIILLIAYLTAGENSIYDWVRDHRVHHKYTETDADPHNSKRGFFFAHVGWLMMKKHPEVLRRGRMIDMSDVLADPVVRFSQKYFGFLKLMVCFVIPILIPVYLWNEDWYHAIISQAFIRYVVFLNFSWSVNSFAHIWGYRSYDKTISPAENKYVSLFSMGEGWHNYHHVFPWDYKAAEFGNYGLNMTTMWIDLFAKLGWAYDRKTASDDLIKKVSQNKGDGTHPIWGDVKADTEAKVATE